MAEYFQQQSFKDIQTKFASSDLQQRLAALSECLKFDQGLDLLAQQALTDSSEQVQQSAYWVLYGDNPYLNESVNLKLPNVLAHDTISCVAISPEHKIIVGGSWKKIRIWNLDTGELLHTLDAHSHWVLSIAISADGQYLFSSSIDKTIKLWSLKTKKNLHTFTEHKSWVNVVKITPDNKKLISGSADQTIKIWDLESKKLIHTFNGHTGWVSSLAVSSDSQVLVSGSTDKTIKLWDLTNQSLLRTLEGHLDWIKTVAITSNKQSLITGSRDGIIKIWKKDPNTSAETFNIPLGYAIVWIISAILAKFTGGTTLTIPFLTHAFFFGESKTQSNFKFDVNALKCVKTISGQFKTLTDFDISHNGDIQVIGTQNGSIHIENSNQPNTIIEHSGFISSISVSSNSKLFVSGSRDWIKIWDLQTGKSLYPLTGDSPKLKSLKISPDYKTLYCGEYHQFKVKGFDQYHKPIEIEKIIWTATGGEIEDGLFQAGNTSGYSFTIQATVNLVSCDASIVILEKSQLTSLKISPVYQTIYCREYQQFTIQSFDQYNQPIQIGQVTWTATGGEIENGLFQAGNVSGSNFFIKAQVDQVCCKTSITILEQPKLASLEISPSSAILYCGDFQEFSVQGFDQYNKPIQTRQVTWTANNVKLPNNGMFIAGDFEETVIISATIERISQSVQVKVIERPKLTSLSIEPQSIPMYPNQTHKFTVLGLDQRGNSISVGKVNWDQTGGKIKDNGNYTVSSNSQGEYTVTASIPGQTISATAKVIVPSILTDLIILPNTISVEPNEPITFELMGLNQVGNWIWVENVQWKCTPGGRINSEGVFKGGYEKAQVTVTAKVNSIEASATVNLLPVLRRIKIYPNQNIFIKPNESITFKAIGYDQYGNEIETGNIFWEAPGKRIDQKGIFTAHDNDKGFYNVTAKVSPLSPYDIRSKILAFGIYTKLLAHSIKLAERLFSLSAEIQNLLMPSNLETDLQSKSAKTDNIFDNSKSNSEQDNSEEISNFEEVYFQAWVIKQIIKMSVRLLDWVGKSCINFAQISDSVNVNVIPVLRKLKIQPEQVELKPKQGFQFKVTGFDQQGGFITPNYIKWDATGGKIDPTGYFVPSPDSEGSYKIYAKAIPENINDLVEIKVVPIDQEYIDISSKFIDRNLGQNSLIHQVIQEASNTIEDVRVKFDNSLKTTSEETSRKNSNPNPEPNKDSASESQENSNPNPEPNKDSASESQENSNPNSESNKDSASESQENFNPNPDSNKDSTSKPQENSKFNSDFNNESNKDFKSNPNLRKNFTNLALGVVTSWRIPSYISRDRNDFGLLSDNDLYSLSVYSFDENFWDEDYNITAEEWKKYHRRKQAWEKSYTEDSIHLYEKQIGRIRLLRADEEIELARKIADLLELERIREKLIEHYHREPNEQEWASAVDMKLPEFRRRLYLGRRAKDKIVQSNLRLVVSIAKKYMNRGLSFPDLIQEGSLGLIRAAEKFDHEKGYKFSTYAIWWIRQAITRAIADQSRTIRLPVHLYESISRIKKTTKLLSQEMGRKPTEEEIAIRMEITIEKLRFIGKSAQLPISLETPIGKEENSRLGDFIESDGETPEDYVLKHLLREDLENVLDTLSPRERNVLRLRYGLDDGQMKTLEEIGQIFNVTRERIRETEAKALRKLQHPNRNSILKEYIFY